MGIAWEAYHKGVQLLGVPGIALDLDRTCCNITYKTWWLGFLPQEHVYIYIYMYIDLHIV